MYTAENKIAQLLMQSQKKMVTEENAKSKKESQDDELYKRKYFMMVRKEILNDIKVKREEEFWVTYRQRKNAERMVTLSKVSLVLSTVARNFKNLQTKLAYKNYKKRVVCTFERIFLRSIRRRSRTHRGRNQISARHTLSLISLLRQPAASIHAMSLVKQVLLDHHYYLMWYGDVGAKEYLVMNDQEKKETA